MLNYSTKLKIKTYQPLELIHLVGKNNQREVLVLRVIVLLVLVLMLVVLFQYEGTVTRWLKAFGVLMVFFFGQNSIQMLIRMRENILVNYLIFSNEGIRFNKYKEEEKEKLVQRSSIQRLRVVIHAQNNNFWYLRFYLNYQSYMLFEFEIRMIDDRNREKAVTDFAHTLGLVKFQEYDLLDFKILYEFVPETDLKKSERLSKRLYSEQSKEEEIIFSPKSSANNYLTISFSEKKLRAKHNLFYEIDCTIEEITKVWSVLEYVRGGKNEPNKYVATTYISNTKKQKNKILISEVENDDYDRSIVEFEALKEMNQLNERLKELLNVPK